MPDTPVAPHGGTPYDPVMEARVSRLEDDMREVKATSARTEASVARIEAMLHAVLPHLATKADIAELRSETKAGIADLRTETATEFAALRADTMAGIADLRAETKADIGDLRTETKADSNRLETGWKTDVAELKLAIARLDADKPSKTYMWGVLAVLITAYTCGLAAVAILK